MADTRTSLPPVCAAGCSRLHHYHRIAWLRTPPLSCVSLQLTPSPCRARRHLTDPLISPPSTAQSAVQPRIGRDFESNFFPCSIRSSPSSVALHSREGRGAARGRGSFGVFLKRPGVSLGRTETSRCRCWNHQSRAEDCPIWRIVAWRIAGRGSRPYRAGPPKRHRKCPRLRSRLMFRVGSPGLAYWRCRAAFSGNGRHGFPITDQEPRHRPRGVSISQQRPFICRCFTRGNYYRPRSLLRISGARSETGPLP